MGVNSSHSTVHAFKIACISHFCLFHSYWTRTMVWTYNLQMVVMDCGMKTVFPHDSNKELSWKFSEGLQVQQKAPEEGQRIQQPKHYEYSNKNVYNSPKYIKNNMMTVLNRWGLSELIQMTCGHHQQLHWWWSNNFLGTVYSIFFNIFRSIAHPDPSSPSIIDKPFLKHECHLKHLDQSIT